MTTLSKLHDATLKFVQLEWTSGVLRYEFNTAEGAVTLHVDGVTLLNCPRVMPWGPSRSVNTVSVQADSDGVQLLVEMQSGDLLEVRGRRISVPAVLQTD